MLGNKTRPIVLIDWSSATVAERFQLLRAAVPLCGRAITIYESVYPLSDYNSQKAHKEFLKQLREVLPEGCKPIIVTDAGFGIPWFKSVLEMGWDFVGRIINNSYYQTESEETWKPMRGLLNYRKSEVKAFRENKIKQNTWI